MTTRLLITALLVATACGDDGRGASDDSDIYRFDGAILSDSGPATDTGPRDLGMVPDSTTPDGGPPVTCGEGAPASTNAQNVLTNFPGISWSSIPSHIVPVTANFTLTDDGGSRPLFEIFVELRNASFESQCDFIPDVTLNGKEIVGLVETPPHQDTMFDFNNDCLSRGDIGVYRGVSRSITESDLGPGSTLFFDADPSSFSRGTPLTSMPTLEGLSVTEVEGGGYGLTGTLRPHRTIYNYGLRVYPRDERGLLVNELVAFPNELETLPAGSSWPFATDGTPCEFGDYQYFQGWINSSDSGFFGALGDGLPERELQQLAIRDRMRALRQLD